MRPQGTRTRFVSEAVKAARSGQHVRIATTRRDAKNVHALIAEHENGFRVGERWDFGPGSVEVVT